MNRDKEQLLSVPTGDPATVDQAPDARTGFTNKWPGQLGNRGTIQSQVTDPATGTVTVEDVEWCYVQGDSTMSVAPFRAATMWWANKALGLVTTDATNRGRIAGICPGPKGRGNRFFIATGGRQPVKFIDAKTAVPTAAGLIVIPSATAGKADCLAAGSAATYPALGVSAGAYNAANAEALVDLSVPEVS